MDTIIPFLHTIPTKALNELDSGTQHEALSALEAGQVIYFPHYSFTLSEDEETLLDESLLSPKRKNISYNLTTQSLAGCDKRHPLKSALQDMMHRYALFTQQLVHTLLLSYTEDLIWGRTSYRPAQITGRTSSKRKDDTRIHVDAFPSTPVHGLRIFRIFCNINPNQEPRVWQIGEPFSRVLQTFSSRLPRYSQMRAKLLHLMGATKTMRSAYDHDMLHLHDQMKLDDHYQQTLCKQQIDFPPQTTWLVFTDQVSHAALSGQFVLEQTFYLPTHAMHTPSLSPFEQLERWHAAVEST